MAKKHSPKSKPDQPERGNMPKPMQHHVPHLHCFKPVAPLLLVPARHADPVPQVAHGVPNLRANTRLSKQSSSRLARPLPLEIGKQLLLVMVLRHPRLRQLHVQHPVLRLYLRNDRRVGAARENHQSLHVVRVGSERDVREYRRRATRIQSLPVQNRRNSCADLRRRQVPVQQLVVA